MIMLTAISRPISGWPVIILLIWAVLVCCQGCGGGANGNPPPPPPPPVTGLNKIDHIVFIIKENRTFDTYFGTFPGADGATTGVNSTGQVIPLGRAPDKTPYDLGHGFTDAVTAINGGKMNKFAAVSDAGGLVMGYYDFSNSAQSRLAKEFTLADNTFHSAFGGSMLNHSFLVCLCAFRWPQALSDAPQLVASLDADGKMIRDGQVSPDGYVINTAISVYLHASSDKDPKLLVPPQTMPHIGDRLDANGITWKWYSGGYAEALAGHFPQRFEFHHQAFAFFADLAPGTAAQQAHLKDQTDLEADIANDSLPQVVFYKPIARLNEHPGYTELEIGDQHIADIVGRLQKTAAYNDTLIIITYDENGGLWDHVAPPKRDPWGPGTRVPLIAIGPMVKRGYIDHTPYEFGSILKTLEDRFGLAPLNEIDAKASNLAALLQ